MSVPSPATTQAAPQVAPAAWQVSLVTGVALSGSGSPPYHLKVSPGVQLVSGARYQVAFAGWLYDRKPLCQRLAVPHISEREDVFLVVQAYRRWGDGFIHHLDGVFAVMVWDESKQLLLCGRDPLGVMPLFYAEAGGAWFFASVIDALLEQPGVSRQLNRAALVDQLYRRATSLDETFFHQVRRVPPGHLMRVEAAHQQCTLTRYWHPDTFESDGADARRAAPEVFDEFMARAVRRCLQRGPAGIFLSGGLDSTSLAVFAAEVSRHDGMPLPHALSLVYSDPTCNEQMIQCEVAQGLGLAQTFVHVDETVATSRLFEATLELCRDWPAPLTSAFMPVYLSLCHRGNAQGCRVILTGDGGDELFAIYYQLAGDMMREGKLGDLGRLLATLWSWKAVETSRYRTAVELLWRCGARPAVLGGARTLLSRFAPAALRAHRSALLKQRLPSWLAPDPALRQAWLERALDELERRPQRFRQYILETVTGYALTAEMEESFEQGRRSGIWLLKPFWDPQLVSFLVGLPPHLLNRAGQNKGFLRQVLQREFPRLGFEQQVKVFASSFFEATTRAGVQRAWQDLQGVTRLAELGVINAKVAERQVKEYVAGHQSGGGLDVWRLLSLEAWVHSRF